MTTVSVTVEIPDGIHQVSCQTTQSFNAFFLIRPNGMVWRCRSAGRPSKPTAEGVGHLQYCSRSIFPIVCQGSVPHDERSPRTAPGRVRY
jgi:hypothetical protein